MLDERRVPAGGKAGDRSSFADAPDVRPARRGACLALSWALALLVPAAWASELTDDLTDLSFEQLGNIEITSLAKKEQRLADAHASLYVITREAIHRADAHTLAEALRLAPNLHVARINAGQYAISARGFNGTTANKLLVLIDGRSIYTPLYSGVFWETQDVPLSEVERIEVISGPGGTLWGGNAVNGVINVISVPAGARLGAQGEAAVGSVERSLLLRKDWQRADRGAVRAYAKYNRHGGSLRASGADAKDAFHRLQLGLRSDWEAGGGTLTVQGDAYQASFEQPSRPRQDHRGSHLLGRWMRSGKGGGSLILQGYLDHSRRDVPGSYTERLTVLDLELQYLQARGGPGQWVVGAGHRRARDVVGSIGGFAFLPEARRLRWTHAFAQYEHALSSAASLSLGTRVEHNSYSGTEWMPSARMSWKLTPDVLLWGALSRSVRAPSRIDVDFYLPARPPFVLAGGPTFRSERANTLELGLRSYPDEGLSYALTLFGSHYSGLRNYEQQADGSYVAVNGSSARVLGVEAWGRYRVHKDWQLQAGAMALRERFSGANIAAIAPGNDPRYQVRLSSSWNLSGSVELDLTLRHVAALRYTSVPAYTEADLRLGWRWSPDLELALSGKNLLHARHREFFQSNVPDAQAILVGRTLQLTLNYRR